MGCVVNGPGESKHADIGISLPGTFEEPVAPVFIDGQLDRTLRGDGLVEEFKRILDDYVERRYPERRHARFLTPLIDAPDPLGCILLFNFTGRSDGTWVTPHVFFGGRTRQESAGERQT